MRIEIGFFHFTAVATRLAAGVGRLAVAAGKHNICGAVWEPRPGEITLLPQELLEGLHCRCNRLFDTRPHGAAGTAGVAAVSMRSPYFANILLGGEDLHSKHFKVIT